MNPEKLTLSDEFVTETIELVRERLRTGAILIFALNLAFTPLYYMSLSESFSVVLGITAVILLDSIIILLLSSCNFTSPNTLNSLTVIGLVSVSLFETMILIITGGSRSPFFPFLLFYILGTGFIAPTSRVQSITFALIFIIYTLAVIVFDTAIDYVALAVNLATIAGTSILALTGIHLWEKRWKREFKSRLMSFMEKEELSRSLHDNIGSDLSFVRYLSDNIVKSDADDESMRRLAVISDTMEACIENIKDFSFSIDKQEDTFTALAERMEDYGKKILREIDIGLVLTKRSEGKSHVLSALQVFNIYMFYKEAITNIVKHSGARKVGVEVSLISGRFELVVEDNGTGFNPSEPRVKGRGINNLLKRARDLGGKAKIDSSPGMGTRIELEVSL